MRHVPPRLATLPGLLDGTLSLGVDGGLPRTAHVLRMIERRGVNGGLLLANDARVPVDWLLRLEDESAGRLLAARRIDVMPGIAANPAPSHGVSACRVVCLSALGSLQSPVRGVQLADIESLPWWHAAAEHGLSLLVEPTVADASLLPELASAFPSVRILVRGGLVCRMPPGNDSPRSAPLPDRFTFDRLHQLPNVWVQLCARRARRVRVLPEGPLGGWHSPTNIVALFSARRVVWASEHRLEPGASYMGAGDPAAEIPGLGTYDREQLLGGALRGFLS